MSLCRIRRRSDTVRVASPRTVVTFVSGTIPVSVKLRVTKPPDFNALWTAMLASAEARGDKRTAAALRNHESRKETICRKMGIVSTADVVRITSDWRGPRSARRTRK